MEPKRAYEDQVLHLVGVHIPTVAAAESFCSSCSELEPYISSVCNRCRLRPTQEKELVAKH